MPISSIKDIISNIAAGKGIFSAYILSSNGGSTAAAAASGFFNIQIAANNIGTTLPNTFTQIPNNAIQTILNVSNITLTTNQRSMEIGFLYKLGTINLTATGDRFTASAGVTFPLLRTIYGAASQAISFEPLVLITTATSVTAPIFRLRTAAGASGYINQSGASVIGTRTMTMPAAATAAQSAYIFRLEDGDSAVQSISAVEVTTASTTGAADVYGWEPLAMYGSQTSGWTHISDNLLCGINMQNLYPAVATSGSVTSYLSVITTSGTNTLSGCGIILGADNV